MKNRPLYLLPLFLLVLACAGVISAARPSVESETSLKAEYLFLEAANARNAGRYDDCYMLLREAYRLAPSDPYIAASYGEMELMTPLADSLRRERAYAAIAERFRMEPTNRNYAEVYSVIAKSAQRIDDLIEIWRTQDSVRPDRSDPAFYLAGSLAARYAMRGDTADLHEALEIYSRLEKGMGHTLPVSGRKIDIYMNLGDTTAVLAELAALEKDAPADVSTKIFAGSVFAGLGMPDSARSRLDKALQIDPDNGSVYLSRADFFREQGDSTGYDAAVFGALESPTIEFAPKLELLTDYVAKLYTDSAQWPRIDSIFTVMQEQNPGEAMLHDLLARYKSETGKTAEAAEQMSYSIDLDGSDPTRWASLVQYYFALQDTVKALETSTKAKDLFPDNGYFPLTMSTALAMQGRDTTALALLDTLDLSRYGNDLVCSAILSTKGDILWRMGQAAEASSAYRQAIGLNPDNYMAMNNFAYFNACEGTELGAAELYAGIATGAEPDNPTYLDTYAWVLFKKGNYAKAKEVIDTTIELYEGEDGASGEEPTPDIYDHAGDIYFMSGEHDKALEFWKKALELDPDNKLIRKKVKAKKYLTE